MFDWWLLLTPLLVLPIFLLFRFVGCDALFGIDQIATYDERVLRESTLVAYWKLTDQHTNQAKDEKNAHHGLYGQVPPTADSGSNQGATGEFHQGEQFPGYHGGLCTDFQGGYVFVQGSPALRSPGFTVEAWVAPGDNWLPNFIHGVIAAVQDDATSGIHQGFSVYSIWDTAEQKSFWAASLGIGSTFLSVRGPAVRMPPEGTYIALTYNPMGGSMMTGEAKLYVGTHEGDWDDIATAEIAGYTPAQSVNLYIAGFNGDPADVPPPPPPALATPRLVPFLGRIAEVAYYNSALPSSVLDDHRTN